MKRVYAFTDESGNHGFDFNKKDVSTFFIVTAIIVEEDNLKKVEEEIERIRKRYFQTGEMKSSSVGKNHERRIKILEKIIKSDFKVFSIVVDKRLLDSKSGLRYRNSFYKFVNNLVHKELRRGFQKLTVCADEIGSNQYMDSFIKYIKAREEVADLFGDREFGFENSKSKVLIQLADFIGGTLSFVYEEQKRSKAPNYFKILDRANKIIRIEMYPKQFEDYILDTSVIAEEYDKDIARICLKQAQIFLEKYENSDDEEIQHQVIILKYLCFRFMNNDTRHYILTKELINHLAYKTGEKVSTYTFRNKIIAKLRDEGVIIASSTKGYKIPSREIEVYDFVNHGTMIIMPMLDRIKKCRDIIMFDSLGEVDLFKRTEYKKIKDFFDKQ